MDRRIKHIMGKYYFKSKFKAPIHIIRNKRLCILLGIKDNTVIETFGGCSPNSEEHKERMEVFQYFYKLGKDDNYVESQWMLAQSERRKQGSPYKKKPKRERKDNQNPVTNTINYGSGGSGSWSSRIRVPSKKHKNRWKNFIKLFPSFKDK
jgi:hypothetical protein